MTATTQTHEDFARTWRFDEDGREVSGRYVETTEGSTSNGACPIIVLDVAGEHRSVWLFHAAVRKRIADEIARRSDGDLVPGELVTIKQGDMKESASGRSYRAYDVTFSEAPRRSAREIFAASGDAEGESEPHKQNAATSDDIPF